jgi:adenine deaminase
MEGRKKRKRLLMADSVVTAKMKAIGQRVAAAQGKIPCDGIVRGVTYLDVFSCEWRQGDIAFIDGVIVGVESGLAATREWNGKGKFLVPGFLDAHVHIESSMLLPHDFEEAVLCRGTTTAICDPHELANVMGVKGIQHFLTASESMALNLRVMLSSCVPATDMETNGGGHLSAADLLPLLSHPQALGLAEVMNMPGVLHGDPFSLPRCRDFQLPRVHRA